MHPFRTAIEAPDIDGAIALLSDDVVFRSPIVLPPTTVALPFARSWGP